MSYDRHKVDEVVPALLTLTMMKNGSDVRAFEIAIVRPDRAVTACNIPER